MKLNLLILVLGALSLQVGAQASQQANLNSIHNNNVQIKMPSPQWVFQADSIVIPNHEAKLAMAEQYLAEQLKPLLAKQDYQAAAQVIESYQKIEKSAALLQLSGQIYLALDQLDKAEAIFTQALKLSPGLSRSHRSLAVIYLQQQRIELAQQHLAQTIALGQYDAQVFGQLAYLNLQAQQPWGAVSGYQNALLLEPNNHQWQQGLLAALVQSQQLASAQALVAELLSKEPDSKALWLRRGQISLGLQQYQHALASFEMAHRLGDSALENLILIAQLHLQHGSVAKASQLLGTVLNTDPLQFDALQNAIAWLIQNNNFSEAEALLNQLTRPDQLAPMAQSQFYTFKGQIALAQNKAESALKHYQQALELNANNGQVLISLAEHFAKLQLYSRAELYFIRAAALSETQEQAWLGHAQLEINQQDYASAMALLNKVLKANPTRSDLKNNLEILQRLSNQQS